MEIPDLFLFFLMQARLLLDDPTTEKEKKGIYLFFVIESSSIWRAIEFGGVGVLISRIIIIKKKKWRENIRKGKERRGKKKGNREAA